MFSFEIVVGDVVADLSPGRTLVLVFGHFEFRLEGSEAGFHEGVVVAVVGAAHALADVCAAQDGSIAGAGVLAATVGVLDQTRCRLTFADAGLQDRDHEVFGHGLGEVPAHEASREAVHQCREVAELTARQRHVGDVADPQWVDRGECRQIEQQVRAVSQSVPAVGRPGHE